MGTALRTLGLNRRLRLVTAEQPLEKRGTIA
jgi:hypothetical protein